MITKAKYRTGTGGFIWIRVLQGKMDIFKQAIPTLLAWNPSNPSIGKRITVDFNFGGINVNLSYGLKTTDVAEL